ncbi:MAG: hypothetical protein H6977_15625 [Gammaproteobacteria bacterium]|nr:hypothetical protein [Gammaproteobacteria bacterium]
MSDSQDIVPFPNPGVRLIEEDERVMVWEEVFEPGVATPAHRHIRDYIAVFPDGGELTLTHVAGELERYTFLCGAAEALPTDDGRARFAFAAGSMVRSRVPPAGTAHIALNEGDAPVRMILIEFKDAMASAPRA